MYVPGIKIRLTYALIAMCSHECVPNTWRTIIQKEDGDSSKEKQDKEQLHQDYRQDLQVSTCVY